jgi:hypothetical protein
MTKMNNIVKFRSIKSKKQAKTPDYFAEKIDVEDIPSTSVIDFTCPTCYNRTKFTFERMVFKNLQFFCAKCGTGWKVGNPMFVSKILDKNGKT